MGTVNKKSRIKKILWYINLFFTNIIYLLIVEYFIEILENTVFYDTLFFWLLPLAYLITLFIRKRKSNTYSQEYRCENIKKGDNDKGNKEFTLNDYLIVSFVFIVAFVLSKLMMVYGLYFFLFPLFLILLFIAEIAVSIRKNKKRASEVQQEQADGDNGGCIDILAIRVLISFAVSGLMLLLLSIGNNIKEDGVTYSEKAVVFNKRNAKDSYAVRLNLDGGSVLLHSRDIYNKVNVGDTIVVTLNKGAFNLPIVVSYDKIIYQKTPLNKSE